MSDQLIFPQVLPIGVFVTARYLFDDTTPQVVGVTDALMQLPKRDRKRVSGVLVNEDRSWGFVVADEQTEV
jgi:hypothetical protein